MKKNIFPILMINLILFFSGYATTYYVDPINGNDTYSGKSLDKPFLTITKAITVLKSGDTTYLRGGTYTLTTTINISSSLDGTPTARINLSSYPGDSRPILDCSSMVVGSSNRAMYLRGDYWFIKGIDFKSAGDNGMFISGSNNIIEDCRFYENRDTGLQLGSGASKNRIINCDSYYNSDPGQGNADGFAPKLDVGSGNYFYGCRAWQNSDDGWDGYMRTDVGLDTITTTLENCWCFKNGYLKNGNASVGNGNGYKMGGSDQKNLRHNFILKNCIAFDNRVNGFDQNNNKGSMTLLNCTGYRNGINYGMNIPLSSGNLIIIKNCISYAASVSILQTAVQEKNSWIAPLSVSGTDFISLDPTAAYGPRNSEGSLPQIDFLHLANSSSLIDAGVDVGIAFNGIAPDLGAFESNYGASVPVELVNFSARLQNDMIELKWKTASEINNYGFDVEKKNPEYENSIWEKFGFIKGNGTTIYPKEYSFNDIQLEGNIVLYRIKQIDFNGQSRYSQTVEVTVEKIEQYVLSQNYPNPFNPITKIRYTIPVVKAYRSTESGTPLQKVTLTVYDILGNKVNTLLNEEQSAGEYEIEFDGSKLASGMYFYELRSGDFISTRRMILMK